MNCLSTNFIETSPANIEKHNQIIDLNETFVIPTQLTSVNHQVDPGSISNTNQTYQMQDSVTEPNSTFSNILKSQSNA